MIKVDTKSGQRELKKLASQLSKPQVIAATKQAMNDSVRKAKTEVKRSILSIYNIKPSRIDDKDRKKGLSVKLASGNTLSAEVDAGHIPINLVNVSGMKTSRIEVGRKLSFASSIKSRKTKSLRGGKVYKTAISVEITKGARIALQTAFLINKFKAQGGTTVNILGGAVFARGKRGTPSFKFGEARMPIDSLSTLSVATAARNTRAQEKVQPMITNYYHEQTKRQLMRRLKT